jgi:peptidoglycan/LPS O-acetylase OafA/YrhL
MSLIAKSPQNEQPPYMVQLDALRALAVFGVLVHHFLPQEFFLNSKIHWGPLGVRLFFVLSGFLITGILLRCRELVDLYNQDAWFTIRRFYVRRFLRLIPIYYLTIFATKILDFNSISIKTIVWHLTYTSNIYFSIHDWDATTSHFWSLSVEEQFYLFWPFIIILLPRKYLLTAILLTIVIGPFFRILIMAVGLSNGTREYILTFACLDSLGMGALLAFCNQNRESLKQAKKYLCIFCFWLGIPSFVALNWVGLPNTDNSIVGFLEVALGDMTASMFFVWLIDRAARGFRGFTGVLLEWEPLIYLGKISYGIYVYHLLIAHVLDQLFTYLGSPLLDWVWIKFLIKTVATITVAVISWQFFEKPINALKRNFGYKKEDLSSS